MPELLATSRGIYALGEPTRFYAAEDLLDETGTPRYDRLAWHLHEARKAAGGSSALYLGLSPEFVLLRMARFPALEGFSLAEAVLAEAERNPVWGAHELFTDYDPLYPEGPGRIQVLFAAWPLEAARLLTRRLRPRRIEPLPLLIWRRAKAELDDRESFLVLEGASNTLALFEAGRLIGFRFLNLPARDATPELTQEVQRSLHLFGRTTPVDAAYLFDLPAPLPVPPDLPAHEVLQEGPTPALAEAAWRTTPPHLDLRYRRARPGEGLPKSVQRALLTSAVLLAFTGLGQGYLTHRIHAQAEMNRQLRQEVAALEAALLAQPDPLPQGVGVHTLRQVVQAHAPHPLARAPRGGPRARAPRGQGAGPVRARHPHGPASRGAGQHRAGRGGVRVGGEP
ncbi:hypothetical protein [Marinithermus hydrothermalis]|uniref:Fimbrial assembly family protein n=1 Tax=Marinithermus hydrothermalis (strain DSM 14884 / JCM 11576 / T1) TaxID=869210 RepID=F2NLT2_MARHT|nr:hypothetical protein [Marinithermus hydrothermalis]AEB10912.1 hypothetical protein Marky_0149 [Marinithermus hydrothermalis DSM 14884]